MMVLTRLRAVAVLMLISLAACDAAQNGVAASGQMAPMEGPPGLRDAPTTLDWKDTSPGWNLPGQKLLLTGVIYQPDGKTPAPDVVLYYYQTNTEGRYVHKPDEPRSMPPDELGRTHGYIRGWIRTGPDGRYAIHTVRPGSYPTHPEPAHIHVTIKEPDCPEYYIDDFVFDDDPLLTAQRRGRLENRCGSGVMSLTPRDDLFVGERNIILGRNVPGHPSARGKEPARSANTRGRPIADTPRRALLAAQW